MIIQRNKGKRARYFPCLAFLNSKFYRTAIIKNPKKLQTTGIGHNAEEVNMEIYHR